LIVAFIGDVVGQSGRRVVNRVVPRLRTEHHAEVVIANAENSAGGFGFNPGSISEMEAAGVDFFTSGNHVWDKREGTPLLEAKQNIVRPANYPDAPGRGMHLVPGTEGRMAVINLQGRVFLPPLDCPFRTVDRLLATLGPETRIIVVDMHAEATSEKIAMGYYLDGRVSMVLGTHTHVPTKDARIMPRGTGYVTDVGMTGSNDSILGVRKEDVIERFLTMRPTRFEVARDDLRCDFVIADIDDDTGRVRRFEHLQATVEG
jgi:2',3'-cyclic-nucleotide 2'-phosphodiesterase